MSKKKKILNVKNFGEIINRVNDCNENIYESTEESQPEVFQEFLELLDDSYTLNRSKRKLKVGESSRHAILANIISAETAKRVVLLNAEQNKFAKQIVEAYKQSPAIEEYLEYDDVFPFASMFERELHSVVENLFTGDEKFKQIITRCQNYAQFGLIYAVDSEITYAKQIKKRHTEFECEVFDAKLKNAVLAIEPMIGLGQSPLIAIFGGRSVCAGIASLTASIMDLAFKKCGIDAVANSVRTDDHSVIEVRVGEKIYLVDPTNYSEDFKTVAKMEAATAKILGGDYKFINFKKRDAQEHFVVVNYFMDKFNIREKMDETINFDDPVPIKLAKIMCFIENNISPMSNLIYPKGVIFDGYEISVKSCFEMCLNAANVAYKTGRYDDEFVASDMKNKYYIDTYRAFTADNKVNAAKKFIYVRTKGEKERDL